ncbi:MAG: FG-GAP-like repeat-containing protein [Polyangiales bacterium]
MRSLGLAAVLASTLLGCATAEEGEVVVVDAASDDAPEAAVDDVTAPDVAAPMDAPVVTVDRPAATDRPAEAAVSCGEFKSRCGGACVDTLVSNDHCGACDSPCRAAVGEVARCMGGMCTTRCAEGFGDCDGDASNGCEVDTRTSLTHCGACMNACPARANATASCTAGVCGARCDAGFGDCDANAATGCEVDTRVTTAHCGACGNNCPTPVNGRVSCVASACAPECDAGYTLQGDTCLTTPPRALRPLSSALVTTRRPTLAWTDASRFDQVRVELCRDRDCATVIATADVSTSSWRPGADVTGRVAFWRVRGLRSGRVVSPPSPTWMFVIRPRPGARDLAWGARPDFNADGRADLAVGSRGQGVAVFLGNASAVGAAPSQSLAAPTGATGFGATLAYVGDVNGDGFGDLAVGAAGSSQVFVYYGSVVGFRATPEATLTGMSGRSFGASIAGVGDIDHDGYADLLVAEPGPANDLTGRALLFRGGASGVITTAAQTLTVPTTDPPTSWGASLGAAGDFDGDGNDDAVVGAPNDATADAALLYRSNGTTLGAAPFARWTQGPTTDFGAWCGQVGDLNGDGLADLAVAAPSAGFALLYNGREGAAPAAEDARLTEGGVDFARALSSGGDLNGDGYDDLVVSTDSAPPARPGQRALIYYGGASGVPASPSVTLTNAASSFGYTAVSPGDLDGDGVDDLVVAAPDLATIYVYRGGASGPAGNLARTYVGASGTGLGVVMSGL